MSIVKTANETEFFECDCHSDEHTIKFVYDEENNEFYLSVYLNQYRNLLQRIWVAIKYVFGYKSRYGDWDCWTLQEQDVVRLKKVLNLVKERKYAKYFANVNGKLIYARDYKAWLKKLEEL